MLEVGEGGALVLVEGFEAVGFFKKGIEPRLHDFLITAVGGIVIRNRDASAFPCEMLDACACELRFEDRSFASSSR